MTTEYYAPYAPSMCDDEAHTRGCPCAAGGDAETTTTDPMLARNPDQLIVPLSMLRCSTCDALLDGIDSDCGNCGEVIE